jgi:hypothetical protein
VKIRLACILLIVTALGAARVLAQAPPFSKAPGQTFHVDLDTGYGHSSQMSHYDLGTLNALHAVVTIARIGEQRSPFAPGFTITLQSGDAKDQMSARGDSAVELRFYADSTTGNTVKAGVYVWPSNARQPKAAAPEIKPFARAVGLDEVVEVWMHWAAGVATIQVGSETCQVKVPFTVATVAVSATNGDFLIDPLEFGQRGRL